MFDFQEELRKLPDQPGVYIMHDKTDAIIYIGKAVSLRKRVRLSRILDSTDSPLLIPHRNKYTSSSIPYLFYE